MKQVFAVNRSGYRRMVESAIKQGFPEHSAKAIASEVIGKATGLGKTVVVDWHSVDFEVYA